MLGGCLTYPFLRNIGKNYVDSGAHRNLLVPIVLPGISLTNCVEKFLLKAPQLFDFLKNLDKIIFRSFLSDSWEDVCWTAGKNLSGLQVV